MTYIIKLSDDAQSDLLKLKKSEVQSFKKAMKLIDELKEHPKVGTGKPEQLKGDDGQRWSRRISQKHRLVYRIYEEDILVLLISAYGHYDDK